MPQNCRYFMCYLVILGPNTYQKPFALGKMCILSKHCRWKYNDIKLTYFKEAKCIICTSVKDVGFILIYFLSYILKMLKQFFFFKFFRGPQRKDGGGESGGHKL